MSVNQKKKVEKAAEGDEQPANSLKIFSRQKASNCTRAKTSSKGQDISENMLLKFKMSMVNMYSEVYKMVMKLEKKHPQAKFMSKPNLIWNFVLPPRDQTSFECLNKTVVSSAYSCWTQQCSNCKW